MNPTVEVSIWLALKSRLESLSSVLSGLAVAWPGGSTDLFSPPHTGSKLLPYIRVGKVSADPIRRFIAGGKAHDRTGFLIITLVYPLSQDISVYEQLAGKIADYFKDGTQMVSNGVCVSVTSYPSVLDGYEDNGYWQIPVRIPWRSFA